MSDAPAKSKTGWLNRLRAGLGKSATALSEGISGVFTKRRLDAESLQDLEDLLVIADLGVETASAVCENLAHARLGKDVTPEEVREILAAEIARRLAPYARPLIFDSAARPQVILVIGVNGTGKTTTIGKLAAQLTGEGKKVMLAAADTFRAAAIEQLQIWGERAGVPVVAGRVGGDPAAIAFEALEQGQRRHADVVLIDTAGRLQNKATLMDELAKINRVLAKLDSSAPHEVVLVVDATTGQNMLSQVAAFRELVGVTGLIMTKLDGTARGGVLVAVSAKHELPIYAIGVGEGIDDLQPFDATAFSRALVGLKAPD